MGGERRAETIVLAGGGERMEGAVPWDAALAGSPLALAVLDPDTFAIRGMSPAFEDLSGLPQDVLLHRPFPDLLPAAAAEAVRAALRSCGHAATAHAPGVAYVHPERGPIALDISAWSFSDPGTGRDGLVVHVSAGLDGAPGPGRVDWLGEQIRAANEQLLIAGVRQLELAEQARRHAQQIDHLLVSLAAGVLVVDGSGRAVLVNAPAQQMLGLPGPDDADFAARFRDLDLRYPDDSPVPADDRPCERLLRGQQFADLELKLLRADGELVRFAFNGSAVADDGGGGVSLAILVFYEVTAKRRLDDLRADYIALISHDLRAPLNSIIGYAQLVRLILMGDTGTAGARWMDRIDNAAKQMATMIDDLVESAHLESGTLQLHKEPAFVRALILNVVAQLPSSEDRARVVVKAMDEPVRVWVDHRRFERVITNLISNALKYSPPKAPVLVRLGELRGELVLSVTDHGTGLPPESLSKLFQRFFRVDPGSRIEGMGLGLYISRLIVEAHGGRIWAESEQGSGSTFSVALPIAWTAGHMRDAGPA